MICSRYEELISAVVDGELTDCEVRELRSHMDECPACRRLLETVRKQNASLAAGPAPDQPDGLKARVKERMGFRRRSTDRQHPYFGHFVHRIADHADRGHEEMVPMPRYGHWGRA